ncbi:MAG: efflux RND transporter periplasmic adaptor subunit [Rickettsiales bacterium]
MMTPMQTGYPSYKKPRRLARWLVVGVLVAAGAWFWLHRGHGPAEKPKPPTSVVLATAERRDVPHYLNGLGTVQANNTVTVRARVDGQITAIKFREGQNVKAGEVLALIDPRPFEASLNQALANKAKNEAALANAQLDLKRYKKLGDSIARQTVDTQASTIRQLTAQIASDQAAIDNARTQLSYTTISAPIAGRTGLRQIDVGNIIHAGDAGGLVVITQLQPVAVLFSLPQQNLADINTQLAAQPSLAVDALAADNSTVLESGKLLLVDNQIDQATGSIKLKALFANKAQKLWPGAFANARLLLTTERDVLSIPSVAVQQGPKGAYVFVYQPDKKSVALTPVTVARTQGTDSVIAAGLNVGDAVVVDGMTKLHDGSPVATETPASATPTADSGK